MVNLLQKNNMTLEQDNLKLVQEITLLKSAGVVGMISEASSPEPDVKISEGFRLSSLISDDYVPQKTKSEVDSDVVINLKNQVKYLTDEFFIKKTN